MRLKLLILTPNSLFPSCNREDLILPTITGQVGVLKGHAPIITVVDTGPLFYKQRGKWNALAVTGGFALVRDDNVLLIVNEIITPESLNKKEAKRRLDEAINFLQNAIEKKRKSRSHFFVQACFRMCSAFYTKKITLLD